MGCIQWGVGGEVGTRSRMCYSGSLLYCPYMFQHYCVIFRELVVNTC